MAIPVADQERLRAILAFDLQPRIDWAYQLEQAIAAVAGGTIHEGNGNPNGLVVADEGDLFIDRTTPAVWQNQNGGTVWSNLSAGGAVASVDGRTGTVTLSDLYDALGAAGAAQAASQPVDSDLTAIAALSTTSYGRSFLALANAAAGISALGLDADLATFALPASTTISTYGKSLVDDADAATARSTLGLGTAATSNTGDFDAAGAAAAAQAASQPVDSDLTAIAALTTTSYGRAFLALANAAAGLAALGLDADIATLSLPANLALGTGIIYASAYGVDAGNSAATNTTNLQAALDAARGSGTGVGIVVMPPGLIEVTYAQTTAVGRTALILPGRVRLHGAAMGGSNLRLASGSDCDLFQTLGTDATQQFGGIFDMLLGGNRANQTAGTFNHGINVAAAAFTTTGDPQFRFENVVFNGFTGHGFYGGPTTAGGGHILSKCYSLSNGGYGFWLGFDSQLVNSFAAFNDAAGVYGIGFSIFSAVKSYNNGRAAWWDGTAVAFASGANAYVIGNGVISGIDGVVYVANNAIAVNTTTDPKTTWDSQGDATWIKLDARTNFVYSSNVSTVALAVSTAVYYSVSGAGGVVGTIAASLAGTPTVVSQATPLPTALPNGPGFHFNGVAREIPLSGCDAQQNSGSGYYYMGNTVGGNVGQGVVGQTNCIATTGVNRTKNPNQNAPLTVDNTVGLAFTLGASRLNAGDTSSGGGTQNSDSVPVLYVASGATRNDIRVVTDLSGVVPLPTTVGTGNRVTYNGVTLGASAPTLHLPTGALAATFDRQIVAGGAIACPTASGTLYLFTISLQAGQVITSISMKSAATAAVTPTHQIFGLYDISRAFLKGTADDTSTAWAAFTVKTLTLTSTYTVPTTGDYYIGILVTAGVLPTLIGGSGASTNLTNIAPVTCGATTDTGLTALPTGTAGAITAAALVPYAWVS